MATRTRRPRGLSANHVNEEERLQIIMNDKSTLSSVRLLGKENWVKVDERPNCFYCARKFRPFSLKRHCRSCGEIVCSNCYRRRRVAVTPTLEVTVRLCFDCIDKAMLLAESENLRNSAAVMEQSDSVVEQTEEMKKQLDPKKNNLRDSLQSTSTSTSFCSRFSDYSSFDSWSEVDSNGSGNDSGSRSRSETGGPMPGSILTSRPEVPVIQATDVIEFLPEDEQFKIYDTRRHEILTQLNVLDTDSEKEYDALCELVRQVFDSSVAAVAFMDQTRQWYKARYGIAQTELPRDIAFCSQLLQTPLPTIIMDVTKDDRFNTNPLVTGSANIRFYASAPICDPNTGIIIGSVFVMDPVPKQNLPSRAMEVLSYVSSAAEKLLQGEKHSPAFPLINTKPKRPASATPHPVRRESYPETRALSLQSVPEEIEDEDFRVTLPRSNTSSLSSSRSKRSSSQQGNLHRSGPKSASTLQPRVQLLDPNVIVTSSKSNSSSNSSSSSNSKLSINDLVSPEPQQLEGLDSSCHELFDRITSTQQLLARQHDTVVTTLTQHSTQISSIEQTVERIEHLLSMQRKKHVHFLDDFAGHQPMNM